MDVDPDRWLDEHPAVRVSFPDIPAGDWRTETGYGWIAKAWFRTRADARAAKAAVRAEGWEWDKLSIGRKVRVAVRDGFEAQRFADFVLAQWPDVSRIHSVVTKTSAGPVPPLA